VIQGILLFRFEWLVAKDNSSSFGLSFQIYVISVMSISFATMVSAILTYHNRDRKSVRNTFSLHTASLVLFWVILLVTKVTVYLFGFMNSPGLFWVPMLVKIGLLWLLLASFSCKDFEPFKALPAHDKFVYLLISSLVPVSIPSKDTKSNRKGLYIVSIVLFSLECLFVLLFAYLIRHFYHFEAYREFYGRILLEKLNLDLNSVDFDSLSLYLLVAVVAAILVATLLLSVSNHCCHPKSTLFTSKAKMPKPTNAKFEEMQVETETE